MINNPYKDEYRRLVDSPPPPGTERSLAYGTLMVDLYYALDEALGRIYELEQTLEGREQQAYADAVRAAGDTYFDSLGKVG